MLYFSRLQLNERNREVRRDLADCYGLHRRILKAFPQVEEKGNVREQFGLLYRVESPEESPTGWRVLVQSMRRPDWSLLPPSYLQGQMHPDVKPVDQIYSQIDVGMLFRFRLRANPTKRVGHSGDTRRQGRRVALRREEEQIGWLARKGEQNGFALVPTCQGGEVADVRRVAEPDTKGKHKAAEGGAQITERLTFGSTLFEGYLVVTNADLLRRALEAGIGSGKAFGFGLLSLGPARSANLNIK